MPASKDQTGAWRAQFYYKDWTGTSRKKCKRGFRTKKEAQDWESSFKLQKSACLDMTFKDFWEVYEADVKPKLKYNTWCTKEYVVTKKILPYFKEKKMNDISARDVIQWQNELLQMEGRNGKMYSGTYLKTVQAELSCIFNHAVNFYELACNPARKAGPLGCGQADEMLFWTK